MSPDGPCRGAAACDLAFFEVSRDAPAAPEEEGGENALSRGKNQVGQVRVSYADDSYVVLETYGVGSMLGFEQLLGEAPVKTCGKIHFPP